MNASEYDILTILREQFAGANDLEVSVSASSERNADLRVSLGEQTLLLQVRTSRHPSRALVERLAKESAASPDSTMLVCPHIPDGLAADCRKLGLNHADLNGRLYLRAPFLLIDREPRGDTYRNPTPDVDVFSPKASRLARAFLANPRREWTQAQLEEATGISRGLISRVLRTCQDQGYLSALPGDGRHAPTIYRLHHHDRLLDDWEASDDWRKRVRIYQYSLLADDEVAIAPALITALGAENLAYTQWFAAALRHAHTTPPVVSAYVKNERLLSGFQEREVESGGNLWLLQPRDGGVFQFCRTVKGFPLVCDAQIYLDLLPMGQRGPEQAAALRKWQGFAS